MSAQHDVARMLALIPWLLERPGARIDEAAEALGASVSQIRRDLGHLDFCGLPGLGGGALFDVTIEGDRVVVSMADELSRPLRLTPREALRLVMTVAAVEDAFGAEAPSLRSALDKVREAAGLADSAAVAVDTGRSSWVSELRGAMAGERQVRIKYQSRSDPEPRWRTVDPWQLDVTEDGWYLHGRDVDVDAARVYRLDRIGEFEETSEPRLSGPPEDLPTPHYEPTGPVMLIKVTLGPGARWIGDAVTALTDDEVDGCRVVTFETDAVDWALRLLLMGAPDVMGVHPAALANELRVLASAVLAEYE